MDLALVVVVKAIGAIQVTKLHEHVSVATVTPPNGKFLWHSHKLNSVNIDVKSTREFNRGRLNPRHVPKI